MIEMMNVMKKQKETKKNFLQNCKIKLNILHAVNWFYTNS